MGNPSHHLDDENKREATTDQERSYYQGLQHTLQDEELSRLGVRDAFQALREHHQRVQALNQSLVHVMQTGKDRERIWREYHEALVEHRRFVHHYLRTLEEHHRRRGYR